jgi:hypothetical protein
MATLETRNGRTTARIRRRGHNLARTFDTRALAKKWADDTERDIDRGALVDHAEIRATSVADVLRRFDVEVAPKRKGWKWESNRIKVFLKEPWAPLALDQDIPEALRQWRDRQLLKVKPQTVNRDLNLIAGVFTYADKEWGIKVPNPAHHVKRPAAPSGAREVTWSDADLALFKEHLRYDEATGPRSATQEVAWVLVLAHLLGLRRGSLCATQHAWIDLPARCIHYPADVVKNGEPYDCPVSREAERVLTILMARPLERGGALIASSKDTITSLFIRARKALVRAHPELPHLARLTIHDQRHTYTTKVVTKLGGAGLTGDIAKLNLLKMTGRKSMASLQRYFNPKAEDLASFLD